jgi:hypothetical protein
MSLCTPWIDGEDVLACCNVEASSGALFDTVAEQASEILFEISGRLFPGECSKTVRPYCDPCYCGYQVLSRGHVVGPWDWGYPLSYLCDTCLVACSPSLVKLSGYPVTEITEVKIDGAVLAATEYRLHKHRFAMRLNDARWPLTQDLTLPDTEDNTWSIAYTYGASVPSIGQSAAAQLACELYKACDPTAGSNCVLPTGVTRITRQGITIDRLAFTSWAFKDGNWRTGLPLVDAFLSAYNPSGLLRRPVFWAPGKRQYAQVWEG